MRSVAILLAFGYVLGCALAALLMVFVAWFPVENLSPEERAEDDWLALASPVVLVLSVVTSVTVVRGRPWWATAALAAQTVVGIAVLRFTLRELSDRSDGDLIAFAVVVGLVGLGAVASSWFVRAGDVDPAARGLS